MLLRVFLKILLKSHNLLHTAISLLAVRAEHGLHPKHRLTRYYKYFSENIAIGDKVLDVGCGNGQVLLNIASEVSGQYTGVDISENNIESAKKRLVAIPSVTLVCSDIWAYEDNSGFDVIIMSNVLEHLRNRSELLRHLVEKFNPRQVLIRVPMYERDWIVPYKKEFGVEWRLDGTHEIEYTESDIRSELVAAGLVVNSVSFRWSEMYLKAVPANYK